MAHNPIQTQLSIIWSNIQWLVAQKIHPAEQHRLDAQDRLFRQAQQSARKRAKTPSSRPARKSR